MPIYAMAAVVLCGASDLQDGSLLFLQHSNKPVAAHTGSEITHVAIVRLVGDQSWVYEATPAKVRRLPLATYRKELARLNQRRKPDTVAWALSLRDSLSPRQRLAMQRYLDTQLGRRYSVQGYLQNRSVDGIHCAHLAATALAAAGQIELNDRYALTPQELLRKIKPLYGQPRRLKLPMQSTTDPWCARSWQRWVQFQQLCGWLFVEVWTSCW